MQENKCFACEKPVQEDNQLKGKYTCANQRCIRFGLISVIYLAPTQDTQAVAQPEPEQAPVEPTQPEQPVDETVTQEQPENDTVAS